MLKKETAGILLFVVLALTMTVIPMIVALKPEWIRGILKI